MKPILVMMAVLVGAQAAQADSTSLITNIQGRRTTSLNGKWQVIVDPYETGYYDYRHQPRTNGYFKNDKPRSKTDLIEYDFEASDRLQVPGDWNSQDPKLFLYEGTLWYKRDFDYHKRPQTRVFVYFGAANYDAIVFVNGERVGEHQGGFTPFNFEITDRVREGANFIVVKVDNQRLREGIPALDSDWWNYGGLTRDVVLVEEPSTFIQDYFIQLEKGSTNHIAGWARLNGANPKQRVTIRIPEAHLSETYTANENGVAEFAFDSAGLSLWSPEAPKLYDVEVSAESDIVKDRIGFRTLETRGGDILLNGNPIFLRGICIHEEAPYRSGRAFSSDDARTLLGWARELGCNFVRLAHYPHNENMVRMADEMGILVWSEVPVYWVIAWDSPAALACARSQLAENITRDKNRASVVLWSMGNETPINPARLVFLKTLAEDARRLDPTRLVTAALQSHYANSSTIMIDDPLGQYIDVIGCNEYVGWYDGLPEKCDGLEWRCAYQKPVVMSEFGGDAAFGLHGDELARFSEEYQARLYEHQIGMLRRIPFLKGTAPWILMDFRSPHRALPRIQDFYNRKGLISDRGQKKKAFFIMQQFYRDLSHAR